MTMMHLPGAHDSRATSPATAEERTTGVIAIVGGMLMLAVALLATASVLMRWIFDAPIDGDFEFVKMAMAMTVFSFLPYTQARRANIMADTFTVWLPKRLTARIDGIWDLAYAALMGYVFYALVHGAMDAFASGETTMQRQLAIWPSIAISTVLCLVLALTAIVTALRMFRSKADESA